MTSRVCQIGDTELAPKYNPSNLIKERIMKKAKMKNTADHRDETMIARIMPNVIVR